MKRPVYTSEEPEPPDLQGPSEEPPSTKRQPAAALPLFPQMRQAARIEKTTVVGAPRFPIGSRTRFFMRRFYGDVGLSEWNDWKWQLRSRLQRMEQLERFFQLSPEERQACDAKRDNLPVSITPYYASLLDERNALQPLRRSMIPVPQEKVQLPEESGDPLGEDADSPVHGLVHRYPDRVLFLASGFCAAYCRYCTRSRCVGGHAGITAGKSRWEQAIAYIERTPVVRDVVVSGGDPLTLSDERIEWLLSRLRRIPHVEIIRLGTKVPAVLPMRVTTALTKMLKKFHPLWMSIHFTHPDELTRETGEACARLSDAGIPLGSQTVLLKGINDDVDTMRRLMQGLMRIRVKPYYLYQCDPIAGSAHFRTPVEKGIEIIRGLRGHTSGYAVPAYVIDAPGGGGKIPLLPDYLQGRNGTNVVLQNYEGNTYQYPDTAGAACGCPDAPPPGL